MEERYDIMCRRLAGRCDGLLEVSQKKEERNKQFFVQVVFMHKSARDFFLLNDMQLMLRERAGSFDPREALCKAILAQMRCLPHLPKWDSRAGAPLEGLFRPFAHTARESEIQNGVPSTYLLDEAESIFQDPATSWKWRRKKTSFLGLAIQYDLQLYIQVRLDAQPELARAGPKPLLYFALQPETPGNLTDHTSLPMLDILLSRSADPEQIFKSLSIWSYLIVGSLYDGTVLGNASEALRLKFFQIAQGFSLTVPISSNGS